VPSISEPGGVNTIQVDVELAVDLGGATGDASVMLSVDWLLARFDHYLSRCTTPACYPTTWITSGQIVLDSAGPPSHRLLIRRDPAAHAFAFGVDGVTFVADPTTASRFVTTPVPAAGPARAPELRLIRGLTLYAGAAVTGKTGTAETRFTDVVSGP
jgi:hypothetical protein